MTKSGKIVLFTAIFSILTVTAFSQVRPGTRIVARPIREISPPIRDGRGRRETVLVNRQRIAMDYDADGKADYVVFHPATNTWNISLSGGGTISTPFGVASSDYFVPGDYNGDGKGDLAVFRDKEHKWYIMYTGSTVLHTIDFGATGDEPVARDYDGDNKTDLAVVRRSAGTMNWIIRKSTVNPLDTDAVTETTNWGVAADTVAPGYYDVDAKCDISAMINLAP